MSKLSSQEAKEAFLMSLYSPGSSDIITLFLELNKDLTSHSCFDSVINILKKEIVFAKQNNNFDTIKKYRKIIIDSHIKNDPEQFYYNHHFIKQIKKWGDKKMSNYLLKELPYPKDRDESERIINIYKKLGHGDSKKLHPLFRGLVRDYINSQHFFDDNFYFLYKHKQYDALINYWLKKRKSDDDSDREAMKLVALQTVWYCAKKYRPERKEEVAKIVWEKYNMSSQWYDICKNKFEDLYTECALTLGYKKEIAKQLTEYIDNSRLYEHDNSYNRIARALHISGLQNKILQVIKAYKKSYEVITYPGAHSLEIAEMYIQSEKWKPRQLKKYYREALDYRIKHDNKLSSNDVEAEEICKKYFNLTKDNSLKEKLFIFYENRAQYAKAVIVAKELGRLSKISLYERIQKLDLTI